MTTHWNENLYSWDEANEYIKSIQLSRLDGYDDWRIPTLIELRSFANIELHSDHHPLRYKAWKRENEHRKNSQGLFMPEGFLINTRSLVRHPWFWSSEESETTPTSHAWGVHFGFGEENTQPKNSKGYLLCVRGTVKKQKFDFEYSLRKQIMELYPNGMPSRLS